MGFEVQISRMVEFLAVAETGSITEAANRIFTAQPVLSKHIKSLEKELGAELLVRSNSGVTLSAAGQDAYETFREIVNRYNMLKTRIAGANNTGGALQIGMLNMGVGHYVLPTAIKLQEMIPGIEIHYATKKPDEIVDGLIQGAIDVAFLGAIDESWKNKLHFFKIANQEVFFVVSKKHPAAMLDSIVADDLSGHPLLCLRNQPSTAFMNSLIIEAGIKPSSIIGIDELELIPAAVINENGFFAVPTFMLERFTANTGISVVRYEPALHTPLFFVYDDANPNPALGKFLAIARQLKREGFYSSMAGSR